MSDQTDTQSAQQDEQLALDLEPDALIRTFLRNVAKRADAGEQLRSDEWDRLERLAPLVTGQAQEDPYAELAGRIREMRAAGETVPKHLAQAAREAWLTQQGEHIWKTMGDAAREIGVSVQSIRNWRDEGAPVANRTAISKAGLYRWLWQREKDRSRQDRDDPAKQVEIQLKQARLDERTGRLVDEAEDRARQGCHRLMAELQRDLLQSLPGRITDAIAELGRRDAQRTIREMLLQSLQEHRYRTRKEREDIP